MTSLTLLLLLILTLWVKGKLDDIEEYGSKDRVFLDKPSNVSDREWLEQVEGKQ